MSRMTRDGTAEVSRDQILRHEGGQGNIHFPCSADHKQDWQPYTVDPYSALSGDYDGTYILVILYILYGTGGGNGHLILTQKVYSILCSCVSVFYVNRFGSQLLYLYHI